MACIGDPEKGAVAGCLPALSPYSVMANDAVLKDEKLLRSMSDDKSVSDSSAVAVLRRPGTLRVVALTVFASLVVFAGLVIGTSFAISAAWKDNNSCTSLTVSGLAATGTQGWPALVANASSAVKGIQISSLSSLATAVVQASEFIETEAVHDAAVWEAYIMHRAAYGAAEPLFHQVQGFQEVTALMRQSDIAMLEAVDVNMTVTHLLSARRRMEGLLASLPSLQAQQGNAAASVEATLVALKAHVTALAAPMGYNSLEQRVPETALLDAYGTASTLDAVMDVVTPLMAARNENARTQQATQALDELFSALAPVMRPAADFWLTKLPKVENCDEDVAMSQQECQAKLADFRAGIGCTTDCAKKIADQEKECEVDVVQKRAKCLGRYKFITACGQVYESALANCTTAVLALGSVPTETQWACRDSAERARNQCIQQGEVNRKCEEDRVKVVNNCKEVNAACIANADMARTTCLATETGKRMECKFFKRVDEIRECAVRDTQSMSSCSAVKIHTDRYAQCTTGVDEDAVLCKLNIERETKKCDDERPCKVAKDAEEASCAATQAAALAACSNATSPTTCQTAASTAYTTCMSQVKKNDEACKAVAAQSTQKWLSEQSTKNEISKAVTRYNDFLPYSLLTRTQKDRITSALRAASTALEAVHGAWVRLAA